MLFKRHSLGISLNPTKTQDKSMQCSTKDDGSTSTGIATSIHSSSSPSLHHGSFRNNRNIPPFVKKAVFIASLGGILFGYDMGVISGALPQLTNEFNLSNTQREMIVSFLFIGGAIGSAVGGTLCDITGRKTTILLTDITFLLGAIQLYISSTFIEILLGRIVIGFAVAVSGIADVSYLHEISPSQWRGAIVSVNEACISLGFLVSYGAGYGISQYNQDDGWRYMFGLGSLIALLQFVGMIGMPESPVWLMDQGRQEDAKLVLDLIRVQASGNSLGNEIGNMNTNMNTNINTNDDNERIGNNHDDNHARTNTIEDYGLQDTTNNETSNETNNQQYQQQQQQRNYSSLQVEFPSQSNHNPTQQQHQHSTATTLELFLSSYRQIIIAIFLSVMQQFCGHPNVLNYAPEIFNQLGVSNPLFSTLLVGVLKFSITCFVIIKIESMGRRFLLLLGMSIIGISLLLLTLVFSYSPSPNDMDDDNNDDNSGDLPFVAKIFAMIGIFGVAGGYAASFGPLTWLLVSELFPSSIRGRALGFSTIVTYIAGALVSLTFLSFQDWLGSGTTFGIYFILTVLSIGFVVVGIPDTAGKDPQTIQQDIEMMWIWRRMEKDRKGYLANVLADSSHHVV